jgi:hypothetical protein
MSSEKKDIESQEEEEGEKANKLAKKDAEQQLWAETYFVIIAKFDLLCLECESCLSLVSTSLCQSHLYFSTKT